MERPERATHLGAVNEIPEPLLEGAPASGGAAQSHSGREYVFGLDVVRATAILLVVISHLHVDLAFGGVAGVELFFVLSGYLVGGIYLQEILGTQTGFGSMLTRFWRRRWARTLPNYALFGLVFLVAIPPVGMSTIALLKFVVFLQNFAHQFEPFYAVSWSLAVEEWFYLIVPGVATLILVLTRRPWLSLGATCAFIVVASAIARLFPTVSDFNYGMRMVVIYRLDALALGVLAAMMAHAKPSWWLRCSRAWPVALLCFLLLSVALDQFRYTMTNWQASALFTLLPLTCVALVARAVLIPDNVGRLGISIKKISQWSYSMYLSHMPIFQLLYKVPGYVDLPNWEKVLVKFGGLGLVLLVSAFVFARFERPLLIMLSPRKRPPESGSFSQSLPVGS